MRFTGQSSMYMTSVRVIAERSSGPPNTIDPVPKASLRTPSPNLTYYGEGNGEKTEKSDISPVMGFPTPEPMYNNTPPTGAGELPRSQIVSDTILAKCTDPSTAQSYLSDKSSLMKALIDVAEDFVAKAKMMAP